MIDSTASSETAAQFDCKLCGHCCLGSGGIVVGNKDLRRLCEHFSLTPQAFAEQWGEHRGGKLFIKCGSDGYCIFFTPGTGCGIHIAKPDICRAWPYFRGNLVDADSLELAKDFCPGIPAQQTHSEFVAEGLDYLVKEGLAGNAGADEAHALQVNDLLAAQKK